MCYTCITLSSVHTVACTFFLRSTQSSPIFHVKGIISNGRIKSSEIVIVMSRRAAGSNSADFSFNCFMIDFWFNLLSFVRHKTASI